MDRPATALAALLLCGACLSIAVGVAPTGTQVVATGQASQAPAPTTEAGPPRTQPEVTLVTVGPDDDRLWPYTSRQTDFGTRTLVMNTIVRADPATTRQMLAWRTPADWQAGANDSLSGGEPLSQWRSTHGAVRYTYVETQARQDGVWLTQRYQLHTGTYLGGRDHVRAYAPLGAEWTALQVHTEYWDWFRLRHTVTDVHGTAEMLETDFDTHRGFAVTRDHAMDRGPLADGLVVVSALLGLGLGMATTDGRSLTARLDSMDRSWPVGVVLGVAIAGPLVVRGMGILAEQSLPGVPPKLLAAALFPVIAIGYPAAVHRLARRGAPLWVGLAAVAGGAVGLTADFYAVGAVPTESLLWHRATLATALGLLAIGATRGDGATRWMDAAGAAVWVIATALMLGGVW